MTVFPETMSKLPLDNPRQALSILEGYIKYITERVDFANRNVTRVVSESGISTAEIYVLIQAIDHKLAAVESNLNTAVGDITALKSGLSALEARVKALEEKNEGSSE